jgi:SagB-type dehydrogenase family enzyme
MKIELLAGNEAEEYHVASSNSPLLKRVFAPPELDEAERTSGFLQQGTLAVEAHDHDVVLDISGAQSDMPLETAILSRRSGRCWSPDPLKKSVLGRILHLANGVRRNASERLPPGCDRNVPSAGALGSVELFCCVVRVAGIEPGLYYFDNHAHKLRLIKQGGFAGWLRECVLLQEELAEAPVVLFLVSAQKRLSSKYGLRAYRLGLMDAGHVSQNIYLVSTAHGLEVCAAAGFVDSEVNNALELDGLAHCAVLALALGGPFSGPTFTDAGL